MSTNEQGTVRAGGDPVGTGSVRYVLDLQLTDAGQRALIGGKGAHLAALAKVEGITVPRGFCVTTLAFRKHVASVPSFDGLVDRLSRLDPAERDAISDLSAEIRGAIESTTIPPDVAAAMTQALAADGTPVAFAVRSSATAEDSPAASFAGQHDSFLNVVGEAAILEYVRRVWASLFTERAVSYRVRGGDDHRKAQMAVVVQQLVASQASGVLFTADPMTSNRNVASVEAVLGLGESLVSGRANADAYKVRDGAVVERVVATKPLAVRPLPGGGTQEETVSGERHAQPTLTDEQLLQLVLLGRRIESHFGGPQDIEWCLADDRFAIVQSRPITTLFPIPAIDDGANHVYVSVGHQQMMTDAMRPLGLSVHQLIAMATMHEAGGRLFVDVTQGLSSPASRARLLDMVGKSDPLIADALQTVLDRGDFIASQEDQAPAEAAGAPAGVPPTPIPSDPAIVDALVQSHEASLVQLKREIATKTGPALFAFIRTDVQERKRIVFGPPTMQVIMAAMEATWWLNAWLETWLGEMNASDALTQSVPGNVTSEMGLALMDVADVIRPFPQVVEFLEQVENEDFIDRLPELAGGREARDAIAGFLDRYGMRCAGEIDITRPRWSERPSTLVPVLLGNVKAFAPGAGQRRFEQGRREAQAAEERLLADLRALPDGATKADEAKRMIDRLRTFSGFREYPKYSIVCRHFVYKQALLREAQRLLQAGVLRETDDVFFLTFTEFEQASRTNVVDRRLIARRRDDFKANEALSPPRVLTSEGETVAGSYGRDDVPNGALVGLAVSGGTIEGRARIILDLADAEIAPGDILVTTFTDPGWTPVFTAAAGLVTEVGGLMTHGAVIAREYGLPAVVGVEHATQLIRDGQQIRVHGTQGYVELLS